jgi:hypothetical protein
MSVNWVTELDKLVVDGALVKDQIIVLLFLVFFVLCSKTVKIQVNFHVHVDVVKLLVQWLAAVSVFFGFLG